MGRKKDAIQPDAGTEATSTELEPTPHLNRRNSMMEEIASKHQEGVEAELREAGMLPEDEQEAVTEHTPAPVTSPAVTMKRVKIDGEEIEVTEDEIIAEFQKGRTGSKRLEEAARERKEIEAERQRLAEERRALEEREAQIRKQSAGEEPPAGLQEPIPGVEDNLEEELVNAIYEGETGKAKDLLKKLRSVGRSPATPQPIVDLDEIAAKAAAQARAQLKVDEVVEKFKVDYNDIVSNPQLARIADGFLEEEMKNGKPFTEALEESGKRTRKWLEEIAPKPAAAPPRKEVLERKQQSDNIPSAGSINAPSNLPQEESASSVISGMRKARGLPA